MKKSAQIVLVTVSVMLSLLSGTIWGGRLGQTPSPAQAANQFGTIQGIVAREGTSDPISDVQITIFAKGSLAATGFTAQQVLNAVSRGANVNPELAQMAQAATRGGPGAALATAAPLRAVSDSSGRFVVRNVPLGEHIVRAELAGYFGDAINGFTLPAANVSTVVTNQQTVEVRLSLSRGGAISGRVLDPAGRPLMNSAIQALQASYDNGTPTVQTISGKPTDDRGEFRLGPLPPGQYYLAVSPAPAGGRGAAAATAAPGEIPVTTLYPSATELSKAVAITLTDGQDLSGMNIQLRSVTGSKISGRVTHTLPPGPAPGGRGGSRPLIANLALVSRDNSALPTFIAPPSIAAAEDGSFEIANVPPGSYDLFARLPVAYGWGSLAPPERATAPFALGRASVEVRGGNVDGVTVLVHQGLDVKGRVTVDGKAPVDNIRLSLAPDDSASRVNESAIAQLFGQIAQYTARIEADGSFTIPVIPEGHYRFQVAFTGPAAASAYVVDIRQGSTSVYDQALTVGRDSVNPLEVIANTNGGSIEGTVTGADLKPPPRALVVAVPPESRRQNPALYKIVQSDAQGRFVLAGLAPGTWKVFAWGSVLPGAYQNADFIRKYEERGTSVTVAAGSRTTANLSLIGN